MNFQIIMKKIFIPVIILILSITLYLPTLSNQFSWDDGYLILKNEKIKKILPLPKFFTTSWSSDVNYSTGEIQNRGYYRPLAELSFAIDYAIYGLNPRLFHLTSILIHSFTSILFYFLMRFYFSNIFLSIFATLFFLIHPVHTESINVISYRTTLLSGFFSFFSIVLLCYSKNKFEKIIRVILTPVLFLFSLFSKETSVILPLILFVHDIFLLKRRGRKILFLTYIPLFFTLIFYFYLRHSIVDVVPFKFFEGLSSTEKLLMIFRIFYNYVRLVIIPFPLTPFYDWNILSHPKSLFEIDIFAGMFLFLLLIISMIISFKYSKKMFFGLSIFIFALLPVSHLIAFFDPMAERFLYISVGGAAFLFAGLIEKFLSFRKPKIIIPFLMIYIFIFSFWTTLRNSQWESSESILQANIKYFPFSFNSHFGLAKILVERGDFINSKIHLEESIKLMPEIIPPFAYLAYVYKKIGNDKKADDVLKNAPHQKDNLPSARQIYEKLLRGEFP